MRKVLFVAALLGAGVAAQASDTTFTDMVTSASTIWTAVSALIVTVVTFGIGLKFIRKLK